MRAKRQRLVLAGAAVVAVLGSGVLAMSAIGSRASYFYAPSDLAHARLEQGRAFRLGGMVTPGSLRRAPDGLTLRFAVHDEARAVPVVFKGIPPDLFREGSGVVAEGTMAGGTFVATQLLAKHDERYRPPSTAGGRHRTDTLVAR